MDPGIEFMKLKDKSYQLTLFFLVMIQVCLTVEAATVFVTSNRDDDGNGCTLREAIAAVNRPTSQAVQNNGCVVGDGNNDVIEFLLNAPAVITLTQDTVIRVDEPLTINGLGMDLLTIDGNSLSRFLTVSADNVTLRDFTIQGLRTANSFDTAISASGVNNFSVLNCKFTNNITDIGPLSISNSSNVLVSGSQFSNGAADSIIGAGAIRISEVDGVIENSIFLNNSSENNGGAIRLSDSTDFVIRQSFFSGNQADRLGGAIAVFDNSAPRPAGSQSVMARTKIINSTFTGNRVDVVGGSFSRNGNAISLTVQVNGVELTNNTIINNGDVNNRNSAIAVTTANNSASSLAIYNNIIAGNMAISGVPSAFQFRDPDLSSIQSGGNIIGDASRFSAQEVSGTIPGSNFFAGPDQLNLTVSQIVRPLSSNGGPTLTFPLTFGSIGIDAGVTAVCPEVDQRGSSRGSRCDVGAFEQEEDSFFIVPLKNSGRNSTVIFNL